MRLDTLNPYMTVLVGMAIITGVKHWWWTLLAVTSRLRMPDPPLPQSLEPIRERALCISCGHLVPIAAMAWNGHSYSCDECAEVGKW